jgi:putative inorganic carbon (HCO3(-)) transporter
MSNQNISLSQTHRPLRVQDINEQDTKPSVISIPSTSMPGMRTSFFWQHRLTEGGLILSMALYYLVGNPNIKISSHSQVLELLTFLAQHINPLYSLPFLLLFALLCWYRLPFAIALLPLSFPYYYIQKVVYQTVVHGKAHAISFSLAEIALWTCMAVACLQMLFYAVFLRQRWPYWLSWRELRDRIGPFVFPVLIFFVAALLANFIAYSRANALRAFREEVVGPLLYLLLVLACLRSYQDAKRLLVSLFSTGFVIALLGIIQDLFLRNLIKADADGLVRIATVYGSGNNIGLLFDYTLPIGLAVVLSRICWKWRLATLILCLPFVFVLYESGSRGAWMLAVPLAFLFVLAFAIRNPKLLISGGIVLAVAAVSISLLFYSQIADFIINGHTSGPNDSYKSSTVLKRPYLWETALHMIHDSPWLGYGMDNWLCHYSNSWENTCLYSGGRPSNIPWPQQIVPDHPKIPAYWITKDPATHEPTGLSDEPTLSHPHNIFLHVWVSMGIFGLLGFIAVIVLFYRLFVGILLYLHKIRPLGLEHMRWMVVGVGAAMLAALIQGQIDSAFLEQDLSFCFWTVIAAILLLRVLVEMPWPRFLPAGWSRGRIVSRVTSLESTSQ